jgi:hypothetical protein
LTLVFVVVGWHRACCVLPLLELLARLWCSCVSLPFATVLIHSNILISKSLHLVYINLFSILFSAYLHIRLFSKNCSASTVMQFQFSSVLQ